MTDPDRATGVPTRNGASAPQAALQRVDHAITADALAERLPRRAGVDRLSPAMLEAWLIDFGLAERDGRPDLLRPTALGRELGDGLAL